MRFAIGMIILALFSYSILIYSINFRSAFEADQACHFLLNEYESSNISHGCDHDIETRQWILFEQKSSDQISHVIKRFHY